MGMRGGGTARADLLDRDPRPRPPCSTTAFVDAFVPNSIATASLVPTVPLASARLTRTPRPAQALYVSVGRTYSGGTTVRSDGG